MLKGVNWIAALIAVVLVQIVGFLWYGMVFTTAWTGEMQALGLKVDMGGGPQTQAIVEGIVISVVMVLGLAWLIRRTGASGFVGGLSTGLAAWFFFSLTTQAVEYVYMNFTPKLMAIDVGYQLVSFLVAGAVLGGIKFGGAPQTAAA